MEQCHDGLYRPSVLAWGPFQLATAENMEMQMIYTLAALGAVVYHDAEPFFKPKLKRNLQELLTIFLLRFKHYDLQNLLCASCIQSMHLGPRVISVAG